MFAEFNPKLVFARVRPALGDGTSSLIVLHGLTAFLRLGSNLVLTRLVAPEAFGVIAIVTSVLYVLTMMMDFGIGSFITRHKTADDRLLETVWTVRFIRNVFLAILIFLGADEFAALYANPEVADAIRVSALLVLLSAVEPLSYATAQRERRVLRLSFIEFARFLITTGVTLIAAYYLRNYWAILIGMMSGACFSLIATYRLIPHRPIKARLNRAHILDLWHFSKYILPSSLISIVLMQADKFLVANFFPLDELGKYMLALMIARAINQLVSQYHVRVFFPLIAQLEREEPSRVSVMFYESRRRLTLLLAFGVGGLIGGAQLVVQVLFNDLYLGAGFYLSLVGIGCLARLITQPALQALLAKGFVRTTLVSNLLRLAWLIAFGPAAYFVWGPVGVIIAVALMEAAIVPYLWWRQTRHDIFSISQEALMLTVAAVGALIGYAAYRASQMLIELGYLPQF